MVNELNFTGRKRLPVIIQTEAMECGLASLTMVAKYHGHDVDLNSLRQQYPISLKGATLEILIDIAGNLDLGSRAIRLELDGLEYVQTPAILHWDLNHFVVLKKIVGNKAHIHDPALGLKIMRLSEVSDHFTGVALELSPTTNFTKQTARKKMHLSELWGKLVGLKRALVQLLILSLVLQLIVLASPFYLQLVVDEALVKFDAKFLMVLALGFAGLTCIQVLTSLMREWVVLYYGNQMSFQMVANIFKHLLHLPTNFYEKRHMGDIISRLNSTTPIRLALTQSLVAAVLDGFMAVFTGAIIFIYSPTLGLIVLVSIILLLLVTMIFYPILRRSQEEMIVQEANEASYKMESIRASIPIKLFSAQNHRLSNWRNLFARYINANVAYGKYGILKKALHDIISGLQTILVIYVGAMLVLSGSGVFTVGMLFAFLAYRQSFTQSATSLFDKYIEFRLLGLHLERIADITHAKPEATSLVSSIDQSFEGKIEIKNVRFRYSPSDPWVLDGITLTIEAGDFIALTGPSGGGKTTLLKLILGLYSPTEGEIFVDGHPLTDANRMAWRKNIGVVMQDDQLLSGSLADNISFFDPQMNMKHVYEVARMAQIHDTIMAMPMGYQSLIGDMGSALSGGQRQRILFARAIYKMPQVLLLDEGTANLDSHTEMLIVDIMAKLQLTRIVVAHRPEFIKRAGCVVKISNGKLN